MYTYHMTRNFRENVIFTIFTNDLKTLKYVSTKNCTLKESLEVGIGMIFCSILSVIAPCYTDFNTWSYCLSLGNQLRIKCKTIIIY